MAVCARIIPAGDMLFRPKIAVGKQAGAAFDLSRRVLRGCKIGAI
jgi:hypothetical protein